MRGPASISAPTASATPGLENAPEALSDAVVLRLGLGQVAQAEADADALIKNHGTKKPAQSARIAHALASNALDRGDREGAKRSSSPDLARAKGAYRTCLDLSVRHQYFDEHTSACADQKPFSS